jgi:hypothetical protein
MSDLPSGFEIDAAPVENAKANSKPAALAAALPSGFELDTPTPAPQQQTQKSEAWSPWLRGLSRAVAQGISFNFADEAEAAVRSGVFGENHEIAKARIRDEIDAFKRAYPKTALASELAGAVAVPGMAGAKIAGKLAGAGASTTRKALAGAAVGSVEGGIAAIGEAEGKDLATPGAVGAGVGAAIGGGIPVAGRVLRPAYEAVAGAIPGRIGDSVARSKANRSITEAMERDASVSGRTLQDEAAVVAHRARHDAARSDSTGTLMTSAGENVRALANETAEQGGAQARRLANESADAIAAGRPGRREYDALHALPDFSSPQLEALVDARPALRAAMARARHEVENAGSTLPPSGSFSAMHVDQADRALQDMIARARTSGSGNRAANLEAVRRDFRAVVDRQLPELSEVQSRYAYGSELLRKTPEQSQIVNNDGGMRGTVVNALGLASNVAHGNKGAALGRLVSLLPGTNEREAAAVMAALTTRTRNQAELNRFLDTLARTPESRRAQVVKVMTQVGASKSGEIVGSTSRER